MKLFVSILVLVGAGSAGWWMMHPGAPPVAVAVPAEQVGAAYVNQVETAWSQAWSAAYQLQVAAGQYVQNPDDARRQQLTEAWSKAEAALLAADWYSGLFVSGTERRRMLAWPVDEGEIDYVNEATYRPVGDNPYAKANFVRNEAILAARGAFRMKPLRPKYLRLFADSSEVRGHAPGGLYAMEFLIWGQQGQRPHSDYARTEESCTTKPGAKNKLRECERRIQILVLMAQVLTEDVQQQMLAWTQQQPSFHGELSHRAGLERMVGSWIQQLQGQLADGALAIEHREELPHEFSGSADRYYRRLFMGLDAAYRGAEGAGLRDWARYSVPKDAARLEALLETLIELSESSDARQPEAWLVGGAAQRAAAPLVRDVIVVLQALRERLQDRGQSGVVARAQ